MRTRIIPVLVMGMLANAVFAAPPTIRVDTPGSAFRKVLGRATVDDVADGRRFRGEAFQEVTVRGELLLPPPALAERRAIRLVVHFRTSPNGPTLRRIVLPDGSKVDMSAVSGVMLADNKLNTINFGDVPRQLFDHSMVSLVVIYPGGFDSKVNSGEFVLKSISLDYVGKLAGASPVLPSNLPPQASPVTAAPVAVPAPQTSMPGRVPFLTLATGEHVRLDWCRVWGSECGKPAADAFCQLHGHREATVFEIDEDIGRTAIISSEAICSDPSCDGFKRLECQR